MLSIIIPSYNHNEMVGRAIRSALNQSVSPDIIEIIVVDDGTNPPLENSWGPRVKIIRHPENKGLPAALNTGIENSRFDKFVILAADDSFHRDYAKIMLCHKDKADIISCDFAPNGIGHIVSKPGSLEVLKTANCHTYAAICKKEIWKKVGGFNLYMNPSWEDYFFWLSAAKLGATWFHVPQPLHFYYRNPTGRDAEAQGMDLMLRAKMEGFHQDLFGQGKGVVGIIIPCYKHEQYLKECIESAYNQIYPHIQIIVVDDGSPTGNIEQIIKEIGLPVTLVRQENKHLSAARNTGIKTAIQLFNPQFLCMLDADDKIENNFLEECFKVMGWGKYVYTDIRLAGDAWHFLEMPDYDPAVLIKRHIHSCTFLMETRMWQTIVDQRGYGYDETMKKGYEDWEFALAALKYGFCGKRLAKPLFCYRNHVEGSMRTEAIKINDELALSIKNKHLWMKDKEILENMCKTCGGGSSFRVITSKSSAAQMINIPTIGLVDVKEPIKVVYNGTAQNTITKIGRGLPGKGNTIYKFTGNQHTSQATGGKISNEFNIFAIDAHLFVGPFTFSRIIKEDPKPAISSQPPIPVRPFEKIVPDNSIAVIDLRPKDKEVVKELVEEFSKEVEKVVKKGRPKKEVALA